MSHGTISKDFKSQTLESVFQGEVGIANPDQRLTAIQLSSHQHIRTSLGVKTSIKAGPYEGSGETDGVKKTNIEMTNEASLSFMGFGGGIGQSQELSGWFSSGDLRSKNYKSYTKVDGMEGFMQSTVKTDKQAGRTTTSTETGFTLGFKAIVGFEIKFNYKQGRK